MKNQESVVTCIIPENFVDTGRCFNGMFKTRNLIEGAIFSVPFAMLIQKLDISIQNKIVFLLLIVGGIFGVFIMGVNGDSLTEFLIHFFFFNRKKRITRYNPRVKMEAVPGYLTKNREELPRDKIMRFIDTIGKSANKEDEEISSDIYNPSNREFFEDDVGVIEVPYSLKSRSERQKIDREKKAEAKRLQKILKMAQKNQTKQGGKENAFSEQKK